MFNFHYPFSRLLANSSTGSAVRVCHLRGLSSVAMVTMAVPAIIISRLRYYRSSLRCSVCPFSSPSRLYKSPVHTRHSVQCLPFLLLHYFLSGSGPLPPILPVVPCTSGHVGLSPHSGSMTNPTLLCTFLPFRFQLRCYQVYPVRISSLSAFRNPYLSPSSISV